MSLQIVQHQMNLIKNYRINTRNSDDSSKNWNVYVKEKWEHGETWEDMNYIFNFLFLSQRKMLGGCQLSIT
jgi:AAA+ superfamily predicted ATPase